MHMKPCYFLFAAVALFGAGCGSGQTVVDETPTVQIDGGPAATLPVTSTIETATASTTVLGDASSWILITDAIQDIEYRYPETLKTEYISTNEWPPTVTVSTGTSPCVVASSTGSDFKETSQRTVAGRTYCIVDTRGAAAGSQYLEYAYTTPWQDGSVTVRFTLQYPQCMNYDDPEQTACKQEQASFDIDGMVDRIVQSIRKRP
jgi:hypothetical protein